jgi:3-dehydroquinate dehydratase type I
MKPKICLSIGNTPLKGAYAEIDYAKSNGADYVELRFDMIHETSGMDGFDEAEIKKIISYAKESGIKTIGTKRDASCGFNRHKFFSESCPAAEGNAAMELIQERERLEPERIKFLKSIIDLGIDICDIELDILNKAVIKDFTCFAHSRNAEVILSVHDFEGEISLLDAIKYYIDSSYLGADYFKLADMAVSETNASGILEKNIKISSIKNSDETAFPEFIIFGMGKKGSVTRPLSIIYGSYFAYCASPSGITAPGQMSPDDFYGTLKLLKASLS